jgi:hypothetical protein
VYTAVGVFVVAGRLSALVAVSFLVLSAGSSNAQDPWADEVVSYTSGVLASPSYANSNTAVGSPARYTGDAQFNGAVTPFSPPWIENQIVGVGVGGSLVMRFDEPVTDDPLNPYGIDLLIFGNSGYQSDLGLDVTSGELFSSSQLGLIEVSQNGSTWVPIVGVQPDNLYPTLGYVDVTHPFASPAGVVLTDFTKPVNPAFNAAGLSLAQIIAGYDGSGGGAGVDLAGTGLSSISYVRITYLGSSGDLQIDAMSDVSPVPGPAGVFVMCSAGLIVTRRRRLAAGV